MKCLWLTLADPEPPTNGQFLYSSGLIRGTAEAGVEVHVVGLSRIGARHVTGQHEGGVYWWLADHPARSPWAGLLSRLPQIAIHTKTRSMQRIIHQAISNLEWDAIVFDSICVGWALSLVLQRYAGEKSRPRLIYLSHNHEESVARAIANAVRHPLRRRIKHIDALKVARLERALARHADLVTSNSPDDCQKFRDALQGRPAEFLPPGYGGPYTSERHISDAIPRRAIIVGSFDWIAKRVSLEDFLEVADPQFAKAGIELYVVGSAEEAFLARLRRKCVATKFTGRVPDIRTYVSQARLALVPDQLGGFKLKALDYVFNRLPILGIAGSIPGMPLRPGESILLYPDHQTLTRGVLEVIDNFDVLNQMQDLAYAACENQFDWASIGRRLTLEISRCSTPMPSQSYVPTAVPTTAL
jgi:polysaccharide biosynthesis protein PslH